MKAHQITETHKRPQSDRVGRGNAAGQGNTSGRGSNGQKSRTGANSSLPRTFTGGGTTMMQRLPKIKGFKSHMVKPVGINIDSIAAVFEPQATVTLIGLLEKGLINANEAAKGIKVLGSAQGKVYQLKFDTEDQSLKLTAKLLAQ